LIEIVGGEEDCHVSVPKLVEHAVNPLASRWVDADRRLVQEEHPGLVQRGRGEVQSPFLAARERSHLAACAVGQADPVEGRVDGGPRGAAIQARELTEQDEVLAHAEIVVESDLLGNEPERPPYEGIGAGVSSGHEHTAHIEPKPARDGANQRGLSSAVGPKEAADLPGGNLEVDATQAPSIPE
jgi:hypothetical protein